MEVHCIFESNSEALRAIWDKNIALFESITPDEVATHSTPFGFLAYVRAYLCLVGDREGARTLLQNAYRVFSANGDAVRLSTLALALEHYDIYADDSIFTGDLLCRVETDLLRLTGDKFPTGDFSSDAVFLGALSAIDRLRAKSGFTNHLAARVHLMERFHAAYYDGKGICYRDGSGDVTSATRVLPIAFGFANEESRSSTRKWLIEESFFVPRDQRLLLYDSLQTEELFDILLPTLLEGGLPGARPTPADLAGIVCIVTHLCGVDVGMMGQGIQASVPHFPHGVSYSLIIPAPHTYLTFESEDYPGALVY